MNIVEYEDGLLERSVWLLVKRNKYYRCAKVIHTDKKNGNSRREQREKEWIKDGERMF